MRVTVVGLGKLGAPWLAVLASRGFETIGFDSDPGVVAKIDAGIAPVAEPRLAELLSANRERVRATTDRRVAIEDSDVIFLLVPTPSDPAGAFSNEHLLAAIDDVGAAIRGTSRDRYRLVVVSSTVMPGSTNGPLRVRLEAASGRSVGDDLGLCYNPEFIALGSVIDGLLRPDFTLIGESDARAGATLENVYRRVVGDAVPIARTSSVNAELTKIAVNAYVTMKISFANLLGEISDRVAGADASAVTAALGLDSRIGPRYLRAATAYGGPCFPRDAIAFEAMARRVGVDANLARAAHAINERQVDRLAGIARNLRANDDGTVAVLGLSYKPGTPVVERSAGVALARRLRSSGCPVVVHDDRAAFGSARRELEPGTALTDSVAEAVGSAEVVIVMVPHEAYRNFFTCWTGDDRARVIVDPWRLLNPDAPPGKRSRVVQPGLNRTFEGSTAMESA